MKETIISTVRIVNADLPLVLLAGVCSIRIFSGVMTAVSLAGLLISLLVGIIVYGRIVARVKGGRNPPSNTILKDNWLNYIVVVIVLALPALLFGQLAKLVSFSTESFILAKEGLNGLVHMATIYVLPIVFIKNQNLVAILAGIAYLFQNLKGSLAIMLLVTVLFALNVAVMLGVIRVWSPEEGILSLVPFMVVANVVFTYLAFMVFAAATVVLIKPTTDLAGNGA